MKWKNHGNAKEFPKKYEKNRGVSMTIPDQSLSVKQIMDRYARGLPLEGAKVPIYDEGEELPDWNRMDLVEKAEAIEDAKQEVKDISAKYKQEQQEKHNKKTKELDDKFNKEKKDREAQFTEPKKGSTDAAVPL